MARLKPKTPSTLRWTWWTLVPLAFVAAVLAAPVFLDPRFAGDGPCPVAGLRRRLPPAAGALLLDFRRRDGGLLALSGNLSGSGGGPAVSHLAQVALRLLIAAAALNLFDAMTELAGLHGNWLGIRFAFGLFLGGYCRVADFIRRSVTESGSHIRRIRVGR